MKIVYVATGITMTFVVNEMEAHRQAGWEVLPLASSKPGMPKKVSELMRNWDKCTIYRGSDLMRIGATLREMTYHPIRFLKVCFWLLTLLFHSPTEFLKALYELTTAGYFASYCRKFDAQHIHVHFASRSLNLGLMLGILTGLPISCTVHAFDIFTRSPGSLRSRLTKCKFIAAISQFNVDYLKNTCGRSVAELCRVVHCGIDVERFRSISRDPKPDKLVCVCRLALKKGLDIAIRACAKLRDKGVKFRFEIIGDGPERKALEQLVGQLRLDDHIKLLGARANDQLLPFLSQASVFLMPCRISHKGDRDGIPVAMMEAMACEIPIVSTKISGIPELVKDGITGYLVPEKDVDSVARVLEELLGDTSKIERFGKEGRQHVLDNFCITKTAAKLRKLIEM
jgi:glycosyltransferase involved in cell wall biosynthesis